jgi:drug/metabolite transporter (DMT)-like permease
MFLGLLLASSACLIWGLVYLIPVLLVDFSPIEIVFGRYLTYGILSCVLFFKQLPSLRTWVTPRLFCRAFLFSFIANPIYYLGAVSGIHYATAPLTVLILGLSPVLIVWYGNYRYPEIAYRKLVWPLLIIILGLLLVNGTKMDWSFQAHTAQEYALGAIAITIALLASSFYIVQNAHFLKKNPLIRPADWTTFMGLATFFWVALLAALAHHAWHLVDLHALFNPEPDVIAYWIGSAVLGFVCSWLGCLLWNRASLILPVTLMGPLTLIESLFGLIYVYVFEGSHPPIIELLGATLMLVGILLSVLAYRNRPTAPEIDRGS